jgi:hypothetical protein
MSETAPSIRIAGLVPWLPWPLSAWRWWTEPVGAERLAALRIGLAGFLLLDILLTYLPGVFTFFGHDALGDPAVFGWRAGAPRLSWSLLRGFGDPLLSFLSLTGWAATTLWIFADLVTRAVKGSGPRDPDPLRYSLPMWFCTGTLFILGLWSRLAAKEDELQYAWLAALVLVSLSLAFLMLELVRYLSEVDWRALALLGITFASAVALLGCGLRLTLLERLEPDSLEARLLAPWQNDPMLLGGAMGAWVASAFCLLVGLWTRPAAIATWALSLSFANLNSSIDNAGDTVRGIILFYLMLCPCGAVWSLDRVWRRWRGTDADVLLVSPWPIRLLFLQLIFIYFCNGLYKLYGSSWRDGNSLFYVMGDFTLARFSLADLPLPLWMMRLLTWSVLIWEVSFPLLVLNRWSRLVALLFGAGFHVGILVSMELGCFVPYTLCMYLPLLPWERLRARRKQGDIVEIDVELVPVRQQVGRAS